MNVIPVVFKIYSLKAGNVRVSFQETRRSEVLFLGKGDNIPEEKNKLI